MAVNLLQSVSGEMRKAGVVVNALPMYTQDQLNLWKLRTKLLGGREDGVTGITVRNDGDSREFWREQIMEERMEEMEETKETEVGDFIEVDDSSSAKKRQKPNTDTDIAEVSNTIQNQNPESDASQSH